MRRKLIVIIIITIIIFLNLGFSYTLPKAQEPYPSPEVTVVPTQNVSPQVQYFMSGELPKGILEPLEWCDQLPAYNNVCAYGFDSDDNVLPRWYMTKDGPIDLYPNYNYPIVWTSIIGTHLDTDLELQIHSYHPGIGINGSGRNIYVSDWWIYCGGGYINWDVWMTNIYGEIVMAQIKDPNYYFMNCRFLPYVRRAIF